MPPTWGILDSPQIESAELPWGWFAVRWYVSEIRIPFACEARCPVSLTKHLDPVKGGRSVKSGRTESALARMVGEARTIGAFLKYIFEGKIECWH